MTTTTQENNTKSGSSRRNVLTGVIGGALAGLFAPTVHGAAKPAAPLKGRELVSKDNKEMIAHRVYTDLDLKTHLDSVTYTGTFVQPGETSIVPPGCTRFLEGPAVTMVIRNFPAGFITDYHTDPAQQHQMTFMIDGSALSETPDGGAAYLMPGELCSVEDSVGEGHKAKDGGETGFIQLFIARPANI